MTPQRAPMPLVGKDVNMKTEKGSKSRPFGRDKIGTTVCVEYKVLVFKTKENRFNSTVY